MALNWKDKVDGRDIASAEDINSIAHAVIENEKNINLRPTQDELQALKTAVATKADKADVEDLEKVVDKKASQTEVSSLDEKTEDLEKELGDVKTKLEAVSEKVFEKEPKTWKDVQSIVRAGAARQYFDIGDQFVVEKLSAVSASIGESQGITSALVDADEFINGIGEVCAGEYSFSYDGSSWRDEKGNTSVLADFGISVSGTPKVGDKIVVTETSTELTFDVIGIDHDTPADSNYTHSMTLQLHEPGTPRISFGKPEALWYIDEETYPNGLEIGTYNFTLPKGYQEQYGGGKTYSFKLTKKVPVGGRLKLNWAQDVQVTSSEIATYSPLYMESVSIVEGAEGTAMPTVKKDDVTANTNALLRSLFGSNVWDLSVVKKWMNSDEDKIVYDGSEFDFCLPTKTNISGFLKGIDPLFLNVIGDVIKTTQKSTKDGGGLKTSNERFFLLSRAEIFGGAEMDTDGSAYEYYGEKNSDYNLPSSGADTNRIKYVNGTEKQWWLRTAYGYDAHNIRVVTTRGSVSTSGSSGIHGVAPACVIV